MIKKAPTKRELTEASTAASNAKATGPRTAAVWVPNWPVIVAMAGAEVGFDQPAVTHRGRRIAVVSTFARRFGIRRGMSLRAAQELCPQLQVLDHDESLSAREFEFIAQVVEELVPKVEIMRPGLLLFAARGPARFYGSDQAVCDAITELMAQKTHCEVQVGVANGILTAILAARTPTVVPEDQTFEFLGPRPLTDLLYAATSGPQRTEVEQFLDLQSRLGIKTFSALSALPRAHVHTRFGPTGAWAHRLASGLNLAERHTARQEPDITVNQDLDPPVTRVDTAAFAARQLAQDLYEALLTRAVTCSRIAITATTDQGTELERTWRTDDSALGAMSPEHITQRVRWQLEGWLTTTTLTNALAKAGPQTTPTHPARTTITRLQLVAQHVTGASSHQEALWGRSKGQDARAQGAVERVQDLLGPQAVLALRPRGGHTYQERIGQHWWDTDQTHTAADTAAGWPGKLPSPAPATLLTPAWDLNVVDHHLVPITFNNRLGMSGTPHAIHKTDPNWKTIQPPPYDPISNWAGPWPIRTGWWTPTRQHCMYLQLIPETGPALLVVFRAGKWQCEGIYD